MGKKPRPYDESKLLDRSDIPHVHPDTSWYKERTFEEHVLDTRTVERFENKGSSDPKHRQAVQKYINLCERHGVEPADVDYLDSWEIWKLVEDIEEMLRQEEIDMDDDLFLDGTEPRVKIKDTIVIEDDLLFKP